MLTSCCDEGGGFGLTHSSVGMACAILGIWDFRLVSDNMHFADITMDGRNIYVRLCGINTSKKAKGSVRLND